ncbi:MAG TPA: TetR/AcrR family transcriptional regulator [Solirubrobacteraceae bacterium]|nr:TetR/AcrR family transcriptional regulator [Solirubrobacteraceae bacterium]
MSYGAQARDVLPRGRHAASRAVVWDSQRERMLAAMADAVVAKGYARVAVADVIERAGVSRKTFYEQFSNKEECFLAAYDAGVEELMGGIDAAIREAAPDWIAAARAGTTAYLEMLEANPALARTFLVEVLAAGPEALARRAVVHERFARQLADVHAAARRDLPALPELEPYVFRACVGAINELVTDRLAATGPEGVTDLVGPVLDIQVKLLLGGVELG